MGIMESGQIQGKYSALINASWGGPMSQYKVLLLWWWSMFMLPKLVALAHFVGLFIAIDTPGNLFRDSVMTLRWYSLSNDWLYLNNDRVVNAPTSTKAEEICCFYLLGMLCCCHLCVLSELENNIIGNLTGHSVVIADVLFPITWTRCFWDFAVCFFFIEKYTSFFWVW